MFAWLELVSYFALLFVLSAGLSYCFVAVRRTRSCVPLLPDSTLCIRSGASMYRSRFLRASDEGVVIQAPLSRDSFVPLRVGEDLIVWAPTTQGLRQFETRVLARNADSHEFILETPRKMRPVERRRARRNSNFPCDGIALEGRPAILLDLSDVGAKVAVNTPLKRGERISVDIPWIGTAFGWVLDCKQGSSRHIVRLRFEETLEMIPAARLG